MGSAENVGENMFLLFIVTLVCRPITMVYVNRFVKLYSVARNLLIMCTNKITQAYVDYLEYSFCSSVMKNVSLL